MFSTHKKIDPWDRMKIVSENNLYYWATRCASDFDHKITQGEKYLLYKMLRSELFLQRFTTVVTWTTIVKK